MTHSTFSDLGVAEPIRRALEAEGYESPTPIQTQAIPLLLEGHDLLGIAQTGTGKTAAFALPIIQQLDADRRPAGARSARALILAPTRELAIQIADSFKVYGRHLRLRLATVFGGVGQNPQVRAMSRGVDVLVATPGRLLDLMNQGHIRLDGVCHLVLDEADRMLDMGFVRDVKKIVAAMPRQRQSLLFSATMPREIEELAGSILNDPKRVEVARRSVPVERIDQQVYFVEGTYKRALLVELLKDTALSRVAVFTRTKHGADRVAQHLDRAGIRAAALHGNKSQGARQRALSDFRAGSVRVLVATDIAARGIDVDNVSHVVNFELPNEPESYVHRIGRTARAGADGIAFSFCDGTERSYLRSIERLTRRPLDVVDVRPILGDAAALSPNAPREAPPARRRSRNQRRTGGPQRRAA